MPEFFKKLFSENSDISSMRVMGTAALGAGVLLAAYGLYSGKDLYGLSTLVAVFVGAAFGGKVAQKFAENKEDK